MFSPEDLGIKKLAQDAIFGGNTLKMLQNIFGYYKWKRNRSQNNVVCANAGLAIATTKTNSHQDGFEMAKESLFHGKAKASLD